MSILYRSNVPASGQTLGEVGLLSKTAAEMYAEYAARVTADGGSVTDSAAALSAIESALAGSYYSDTRFAVSPNWGVRVTGSTINKLYSLVGTIDVTPTGPCLLDTTAFAWATAYMSTIGAYVRTPNVLLADGNEYAVAISAKSLTTATSSMRFDMEGLSSTASMPFLIELRPAGSSTPVSVDDVTDARSSTPSRSISRDNASQCIFVEASQHRMSHFDDGAMAAVVFAANALYDGSLITRKFIMNGQGYVGSALLTPGTGYVNEFWHLASATLEKAGTLSYDQGLRYPA